VEFSELLVEWQFAECALLLLKTILSLTLVSHATPTPYIDKYFTTYNTAMCYSFLRPN